MHYLRVLDCRNVLQSSPTLIKYLLFSKQIQNMLKYPEHPKQMIYYTKVENTGWLVLLEFIFRHHKSKDKGGTYSQTTLKRGCAFLTTYPRHLLTFVKELFYFNRVKSANWWYFLFTYLILSTKFMNDPLAFSTYIYKY